MNADNDEVDRNDDNIESAEDDQICTQSQKEIYQENNIELNVESKRRKAMIHCAKIYPLAFMDMDIISIASSKLKKLNLVNTRFIAQEQEKLSESNPMADSPKQRETD